MTSDLFGFSILTRELALKLFDDPPHALAPAAREVVFAKASGLWQGFAAVTIEGIGALTNPDRLKPAHLSADRAHYITQHDEAAFGEGEKIEHVSEMPALYTRRIIEAWRHALTAGMPARLDRVMRPATCPLRSAHSARQSANATTSAVVQPLHRPEDQAMADGSGCPVTRLLTRFATRSRRAAGRAVPFVA
jgi:hypothetical protein